jgi:hypothetical protein
MKEMLENLFRDWCFEQNINPDDKITYSHLITSYTLYIRTRKMHVPSHDQAIFKGISARLQKYISEVSGPFPFTIVANGIPQRIFSPRRKDQPALVVHEEQINPASLRTHAFPRLYLTSRCNLSGCLCANNPAT